MKGEHVQGIQGYSLASAIDGTAPGGVSDEASDPPPARCRWCGGFLSVRNRPAKKRSPAKKKEIPSEVAGHDTGLKEVVKAFEKPRAIHREDPPDTEQLCHVHQRATLDWHQGFSIVRPPHYPSEDPDAWSARKRPKKT
ncbi:MAG: hypothetical protein AAB668_02840 [Patescibacteria group bacterium]